MQTIRHINGTGEPTAALTFSIYGITDFDVQYWDGINWVTVPGGAVTGNNLVWRKFSFASVTTNKIRVNVRNALAGFSRITEIEAYTAPNTSNNTLQYTGRELDNDSGLYQYRARYYDREIGRFISEDPKGFGAGVNFYAYTNNNPVNANDPSGLELVAVPLPGTGNVTRNFLFDSKIAPSMTAFVRDVRDSGIPVTVNLAFRTTAEQQVLYNNRANNPNPVAPPGTSRHESGFAIDLNGLSKLSASDSGLVKQIASQYGLSPIGNDPPHFQANPVDYGYSSKSSAIKGNQFDYKFNAATDFATLPYSVARDFDMGSAAGGFLLYPNKPNTNQVQGVYSK